MARRIPEMLKNNVTLYFGPWYRKTPFTDATRRYGCSSYDIYNHTYLPGYYDNPETEYWALLNDVTIWDVGCERIVEISGPDASAFINTLTCRYNGVEVFRAEMGSGVSANPLLQFHVRVDASGEFAFDWVDDSGARGSERATISVTG